MELEMEREAGEKGNATGTQSGGRSEIDWGRFVLRRAAGQIWLLDVAQPGRPYRKPLQLSGTAGEICRLAMEGHSREEIAEEFARVYDESVEEMLEDVESFLEDLRGRL